MTAKLKGIRAQLRQRMHERLPGTGKWLQQVVRGYFQYHAIPGNSARMRAFRSDVLWSWLQTLRRRSQNHRMNWERAVARLASLLPPAQIVHPYPDVRFDAKHPRKEPCALAAPARVCAGGSEQSLSLPRPGLLTG